MGHRLTLFVFLMALVGFSAPAQAKSMLSGVPLPNLSEQSFPLPQMARKKPPPIPGFPVEGFIFLSCGGYMGQEVWRRYRAQKANLPEGPEG